MINFSFIAPEGIIYFIIKEEDKDIKINWNQLWLDEAEKDSFMNFYRCTILRHINLADHKDLIRKKGEDIKNASRDYNEEIKSKRSIEDNINKKTNDLV